VIGLSAVVHLVVLALVGLYTPAARYVHFEPVTPVTVTLLPPLSHDRVHQAKPQASTAPSAGRPAPLLVHAPKAVSPTAPPSPIAAPTQEPGAASGIGTSHAPGPLPAEDSGVGVHAFLRGTVGCDYGQTAHLTQEEKARCAERFGRIERNAPPFSGIPPEKLGGYLAEAAANARRRDAHDQNIPMTAPVVACDGVGSNFGTGCLPASAHFKVKTN